MFLKGGNAEEDSGWEETALSIILKCSMKNRTDGILLRKAVWPCIQDLDKFPQVMGWGSELAFVYRCANRETDACSVEQYIWQRLAHTELDLKNFGLGAYCESRIS